MTERRVVITGMGAVSPLGNNVTETWEGIKAGKNGIGLITKIEASDLLDVTMGAEVKNFEYRDKKEGRRMDLFCQYGATAAAEAMADSGLVSGENIDPDRIGVYAGSGIGGVSTLENEIKKGAARGLGRVSPVMVPMIIGNILAGNIAILNKAYGSAMDIVTACACGTHAIGEAWRTIRHGYIDAVIAGAGEAPFAATCFAGFANMTAMSQRQDPDRCSTPFDKERDGFIMGEGAGMLIVEAHEHAVARGANIIAELVGYGSTCDAFHITQPAPGGEGAAKAMQMALDYAGIEPSKIAYINAHGTGTPYNDLYETQAIKSVFGEAAYKIPVSSTKSMTGHMLGAAGAVEAIISIKAMADSLIPPTINLKVRDEELDLDYVSEGVRGAELEYVMSNSLGFGGHNGTIIFKKYVD
ncbi:MAG: beta-ketoacyl-ACP synthase II [Clostridiales Family XIII bacterium]|jgi:3-oxoacyl-[acyl-carrier-protein] synthase II|nr:beta-ketoacyl-ACP synthase II [Clostridiales Family XIII bacterium]